MIKLLQFPEWIHVQFYELHIHSCDLGKIKFHKKGNNSSSLLLLLSLSFYHNRPQNRFWQPFWHPLHPPSLSGQPPLLPGLSISYLLAPSDFLKFFVG